MNYLITGGAGFIGGHLAHALRDAGHRVTVLDDLSTGSLANIADLTGNDAFRFIRADLLSMKQEELTALAGSHDVICHLAAAVGVELVTGDPIRTIRTNVQATEKILEAAALRRTRIVIASTSEVYGKSAAESFSERDDLLIGTPQHGRWAYACSKLLDEFYLMAYHRLRGLPGTVVRFFNTVGPRQTGRYGMVIPRMVEAALSGAPIRIFGDGKQSRCFCHVSDTVRALIGLFGDDRAVGNIYNIGSTELISIGDLAQRIKTRLNSVSPLELVPYEDAYRNTEGFEDMRRRKPDTGAIRALLGWQSELPLDKIIDDVAASLRAGGMDS